MDSWWIQLSTHRQSAANAVLVKHELAHKKSSYLCETIPGTKTGSGNYSSYSKQLWESNCLLSSEESESLFSVEGVG